MRDFPDINLRGARFNMVPNGHDMDLIRWGSFTGRDGKARIAAFRVTMLEAHFAHEAGSDLVLVSDVVASSEEAQMGALHQAYEWNGSGFEAVNPSEQGWFKFL